MFLNYLKVAFRNLLRRKRYSFINIFGLAVGLASTMVIGTWVYQEYSYDRHFENADRIYRVGVNFYNIGNMARGPAVFTDVVRQDFSQVEMATRLYSNSGGITVTVDETRYTEPQAFHADSSFFELFSYRFVEGDPATALDRPRSVVLTKTLAQKYFSGYRSLGKTVLLEVGGEDVPHTVTGVVESGRNRSHIPAELWISREPSNPTSWTSASPFNYVLLREGVSEAEFRAQLDRLIEYRIYPGFNSSLPYDEWKNTESAYHFLPVNIQDIYLKSDFQFEIAPTGNETNVQVFAAVAFFILLLAAINFINIVTARGSARAREVGIRKTMGTGRSSLVFQFLMESVLTCVLSMVVALGLAEGFLAFFKSISGIDFLQSIVAVPEQFAWMFGIAAAIGVIAGLYPAFYLTRYEPARVLKGSFRTSSRSTFRNALVVSQFSISICLIICSGFVWKQLQFMQSKDLGLSHEQVVVIENIDHLGDRADAFRNELAGMSAVGQVSFTNRIPAGDGVWVQNLKTEEMEEEIPMQTFPADAEFLPLLNMRLVEGRNFSAEIASDTNAVILNRSAVEQLMPGENPIGMRLNENLEVIGVVENFHFESMREEIAPAVITWRDSGDFLLASLQNAGAAEAVEQISSHWNDQQTGEPLQYYFLDRNFERLLEKERILSNVIWIFTLLAIFISCLGLYGLSSYITEQRTKEIGIRRILGAGVTDILFRLNRSFTAPVAIAILIAIPSAYLVMNRWISNFAYQTDLDAPVFMAAAGGGLLIAWLTVSWQSLRAAQANPVESLRNE